MQVKGIIFDYGGTLDSRGDHWSDVIYRTYHRAGVTDVSKDIFMEAYVKVERMLGREGAVDPGWNFLRLMEEKIRLQTTLLSDASPLIVPAVAQTVARLCHDYARSCITEISPLLERLSKRFPLVLCSNFYGNLRSVVADMGIAPYFKYIYDSGCEGPRKPDPGAFRIAARNAGFSTTDYPGLLMVGDSIEKDILPAHSLGMCTALLPGTPRGADRESPPLPASTIVLGSLKDVEGLSGNCGNAC